MKIAQLFFLAGLVFATATACSSSRSRGGGPVFDGSTGMDSSIDENGPDGSIIVIGQPDGAIGQPDATISEPDATLGQPDATVGDNRTRECGMYGPALRAVWDEPRCESATSTCIADCDGTQEQIIACAENCLALDNTTPRTQGTLTIDCEFCLNYETFRCYYSSGCDLQMANFGCCLEDKCSGLVGSAQQTCAETMCATEGQAQNTCFASKQGSCAGATDTCYP